MEFFLKKLSIAQTIVLAYAFLITCGAILLWLPISSSSGEWTPFIDALFTATSATAVTGQVTLDTATHWNYLGKTVIISLIEVGGLGFMTVWILFYYYFFRQSPNLKQRQLVSESLSLSAGEKVQDKVIRIVRFALICHLIGAILLSFVFIPQFGTGEGIYFSFFHSISAFNNAGFDLFGNSLIDYQSNPYIILVIAGLIMSGGLGFIVWEDLVNYRKTNKLKNYTKIVLITTISLWILGTVMFWLTERNNGTFSHLSTGEQFVNYFFMSVTPRTAGFANIDYSTLSLGSIFLTILLMFIGASSGSTGGGIKVTTLVVIVLVIYRSINYRRSNIMNRTIAEETVRRSFFIFSSGLIIAGIATFILLNTETIPDGFGIEYILIEVFSVLGTVGLTMGLTPSLTVVGKLVLIILMLIGRVGVLTFLFSLTSRTHKTGLNYPEIRLLVG